MNIKKNKWYISVIFIEIIKFISVITFVTPTSEGVEFNYISAIFYYLVMVIFQLILIIMNWLENKEEIKNSYNKVKSKISFEK